MKVPHIDLGRAFNKHRDDYMRIAEEAWSSGMMVGGPFVEEFEKNMAEICHRKYGIAVASCTDALFFALKMSDIGDGDEVIVTSHSFVASASCILRAGATPVFMDIDPKTFMIDPIEIEKHITKKTKAIIAVHLYGQSMPIEVVEYIARKNSLILIEDAAQSYGAFYNDRPVGSMGDISCISFDPLKTTGSFGNGGMIVVDDEDYANIAAALGNHGRFYNGSDNHFIEGCRSKMSSAEAGMLNFRLNDLDNDIAERERIANIYNEGLSGIPEVALPYMIPESSHVWHKYIILVDDILELRKFLNDREIGTRDWMTPLYREPIFEDFFIKTLPNSDLVAKHILGLPIYAEMTDEEAWCVVEAIIEFYNDFQNR